MNMKTLTFCALAAMLSGAASAGPYIGADLQFTAPFVNNSQIGVTPQHFGVGDVHAGWRQGHMAAEAGYLWAGRDEGANHFEAQGPTLDTFVFLPLFHGAAEAFATAGAADLSADNRNTVSLFSATDWTWRAGAGMQWGRAGSTSARLMVRYEDFSFGDRARGGVTFTAGINFPLGGR